MKVLCGKCKGRGRLGDLVCPVCRGARLLVSEPRADAEEAIPSSEARSYSHKDTPHSFWERMRMIHGDEYVGP